jgi:hypothetical protein
MNPLIRLIAVLVVAAGGSYYAFSTYHTLKREDEHKLDLQRIEKEFLERANWVNVVPSPEKYREERAGIDKWYFGALADHYNHFPQFKNYYRVQDELSGKAPAASGKKGKKPAKTDDGDVRKEYFELTKATFDAMKDGHYAPAFTGTANSLRLDLLKLAKRTDGQKGFRVDLVLWGAQRQLDKQTQAAGNTISRMNTAASFSGLNFRFFDEKGKVAAEMPVTGDPEIKVDYPERWIAEFPPQAVVGYYTLPPLPANATKMELTMSVTSRSSSGSEIPASFKWEIPVEADWKLAPGETWEGATTEERSKDYIEGKAENP